MTLIEKRSDAQTKPMHNVNIQVFTSADTPGVQPVDVLSIFAYNHFILLLETEYLPCLGINCIEFPIFRQVSLYGSS